jgi:AcrR family transcriptional regulator
MPMSPFRKEQTAPVATPLASPKARILAAARDAVAANGWKDAQIALIAHQAGVATGSVYRHFESKADLYAQVLGMVSEREVAVVAAIIDSEGPASQRLVDAIFLFSLRAMRGRTLAYAMIAEPCEPEIDVARLRYRGHLADQIARLIEDGIACGEFVEVDVHLAASCVTGAFMEALVGPLAPTAEPGSDAARLVAQSIAGLAARMVFRQSAPKLTIVSKGLP